MAIRPAGDARGLFGRFGGALDRHVAQALLLEDSPDLGVHRHPYDTRVGARSNAQPDLDVCRRGLDDLKELHLRGIDNLEHQSRNGYALAGLSNERQKIRSAPLDANRR